jgi:phosphoglucosamine mutase
LIRVMVESDDEIECDMLANELAEKVRQVMA